MNPDGSFQQTVSRAKEEIAALLGGKQSDEPETILQSATRIAGRSQSASGAGKGTQPVNRKERAWYSAAVRPEEEAAIKAWAIQQGIWRDETAFNAQHNAANYLSEGAEQKVYLQADGRSVVKVNSGVFHGTWLEFFCRLILHNYLFPDVTYTVAGFTEQAGALVVVLEQPFVAAPHGAGREAVEAFMQRASFIRTKNDDYYNRQRGLILDDLHDENVLQGEGENIFFIDPVIYFETPDMGLGSESLFLFPFGGIIWSS